MIGWNQLTRIVAVPNPQKFCSHHLAIFTVQTKIPVIAMNSPATQSEVSNNNSESKQSVTQVTSVQSLIVPTKCKKKRSSVGTGS